MISPHPETIQPREGRRGREGGERSESIQSNYFLIKVSKTGWEQ